MTLRDCELSAFVQPSSSLMMSWPRVQGGERHNYTLYLCHHDECKTEVRSDYTKGVPNRPNTQMMDGATHQICASIFLTCLRASDTRDF